MRKATAVAVVLTILAGCNYKGVEMKNASVGEVANAMSKQGDEGFIDPGKWQRTVTLVSVDAPGMPQQAKDAVQQAMKQPQMHEVCLSPEEAKSPREKFFTGADENCRYEHFNWGKGKIDLKMLCNHPNAKQTMALSGTYEPRSYSMTMTATNEGSTPQEQMTMTMRVDAKNVGECTPAKS